MIEVHGSVAALRALHSHRVATVLLEVTHPRLDAFELLTRIKRIEPRIQVILVARAVEPVLLMKGGRLGALDCLTTPLTTKHLGKAVAAAAHLRFIDATVVLLAGTDPVPLASLGVFLSRFSTLVNATPQHSLPSALETSRPILVVSAAASAAESRFTEELLARFTTSKFLVLGPMPAVATPSGRNPRSLLNSNVTLVESPYRLDDALDNIARLVPEFTQLSAVSAALGLHIQHLLAFIAKSYRQHLDARVLAHAVGLSADHLAHLVHDRLGVSLMECVTRFRFEVARHLIATTPLILEDIAERCGFSSASHFSRVFLERSGLRPGDYRSHFRDTTRWRPSMPRDGSHHYPRRDRLANEIRAVR
jgi:AraC-like DNA-binding protein/CheY-like chemotaxis protein